MKIEAKFKSILVLLAAVSLLSACASNKMKERKEQRDKAVQSSKMYCEFINGDMYPDIDVALNIEMAKHCDADRPFSISQYKTPSESVGVLYCCSVVGARPVAPIAIFDKSKKNPLESAADKSDKKEAQKDGKKEDGNE